MSHKFPYKWHLADGYPAKGIEYHGTTVMTTFACGGGSTMGYKLAGYDVVAANDIDPQMAKVYKANHNPKQFFLCGIKELLERDDLPQVDVLDGSPPCSLFSTAGVREEGWQKEKMFREGQAKQILDDLFFDFIDLAEKMQPKIVIAENVKGMIIGNAKWYTREVVRRLNKIGYTCQVFLFNAATMGVPQRRERVFFIAHKTNNKMFDKAKSLYELGLTQAEVAEQLGTTQKVIWSLFKRNGYKSRVAKKRNQTGKNNAYWGGKTGVVGYAANHLRVDRERGKPSYCVMCESPVPCHWANVSGQYENPYDYIRLCISCHSKFDKKINNLRGKK